MKAFLKAAARVGLHRFGGLGVLRYRSRRRFRILMFHDFRPEERGNVEALCSHVARYFEPVTLSAIVAALEEGKPLPDNAVTVTVDDGYRNFLNGHPIFRKHRIPVTLYAVSGFSDGRLWLWTDQVQFCVQHTSRASLDVEIGGRRWTCPLETPQARQDACESLWEVLERVPNDCRVGFLARFASLCGVTLPPEPPAGQAAMSWDDLRAVAAEGVEIGCHTATHPILSNISDPGELEREVADSRKLMEERLRIPVRHFCYPNGSTDEAAVACVRRAGFVSAVTTVYALGSAASDPFRLSRVPFDCRIPPLYGRELMAGLHM